LYTKGQIIKYDATTLKPTNTSALESLGLLLGQGPKRCDHAAWSKVYQLRALFTNDFQVVALGYATVGKEARLVHAGHQTLYLEPLFDTLRSRLGSAVEA